MAGRNPATRRFLLELTLEGPAQQELDALWRRELSEIERVVDGADSQIDVVQLDGDAQSARHAVGLCRHHFVPNPGRGAATMGRGVKSALTRDSSGDTTRQTGAPIRRFRRSRRHDDEDSISG